MNEMWEVDFLYIDKHQSFLQVENTIFGGPGQACPDSQSDCEFLQVQYLKKDIDRLPYLLHV